MISRTRIITFLAGFETFHALLHAYLGTSKRTRLQGHPVEELGIKVTPRFHMISAVANGAVTVFPVGRLTLPGTGNPLRIG